jgi:hypothetical protein
LKACISIWEYFYLWIDSLDFSTNIGKNGLRPTSFEHQHLSGVPFWAAHIT